MAKQNIDSDNSENRNFSEWFKEILADIQPDLVVGIARGAVRFFQLFAQDLLVEGLNFISHEALPFLPKEKLQKKRILLFDDSVIFGSTMDRVKKYLENREAIVYCSAYVVDRTHFYGENEGFSFNRIEPSPFSKNTIFFKYKLWPKQVKSHHGHLVRKILATPLHYNLDFPSYVYRVGKYGYDDIPYFTNLIKRTAIFHILKDVSSSISCNNKIPRFSGLFNLSVLPFKGSSRFNLRPYSKIRITFVPQMGQIKITPILQLYVANDLTHLNIMFENDTVSSLWRLLFPPEDIGDPFYHQSLFRLLTAFICTVIGADVCNRIANIYKDNGIPYELLFDSSDIDIVLGRRNSERLEAINNRVRGQTLDLGLHYRNNEFGDEIPNDLHLRNKMLEIISANVHRKPDAEEDLAEALGKLFLVLREATDDERCRNENPSSERLDKGLNYEAIKLLLRDAGQRDSEINEISLAIDEFVDRGLAVPKVITEESHWFRAFYCGENEYDQDLPQLKNWIRTAYTKHLSKKKSKPLDKFEFQKLGVCLKNTMPWLPIQTPPYIFGYTSLVGSKQLVDWVTKGRFAPFRLELQEKKVVVVPREKPILTVDTVWNTPEDEKLFLESFDYFASAINALSDNGALLLTTCRTHRYAFNCVAFEVHFWAREERAFGSLISNAELSIIKDRQISAYTINMLYWCIQYITEAYKKKKIFYKTYDKHLLEVEKAFQKQGQSGERWFQYLKAKSFFDKSMDKEIETKFNILLSFLDLAKYLTIFCGRSILDAGLISWNKLESVFKVHGTSLDWADYEWFSTISQQAAAQAYNDYITEKRNLGTSQFTTLLPIEMPPSDSNQRFEWALKMIKLSKDALNEFRTTLNLYIKKYQCIDERFPFSPDSRHRVLSDGSIENILENIFMLTIDIIKGTDSEQTNTMKDEIIALLKRLQPKGLVFQDTGDDKFIACCYDPLPIWDAVNALRVRGETYIKPAQLFRGTRKAIYYGSVSAIIRPNNSVILRDIHIPNDIPRAFSLLDGLDQNCAKDEINSRVAIEAETALNKLSAVLKLDEKRFPLKKVKAKHFEGYCRIIEL